MISVVATKADLRVTNVKVLYHGEIVDSGVAVKNAMILKLGKEADLPGAEESIDGKGTLLLPGAVDVHVHLRDQGLSHKETFETGTAAAVAGGVTTVLDMPNNSPPTDISSNLKERMKSAQGRIYCNVGFHAAPTRDPSVTRRVLEEGAFGLKVNMLKPIGEYLNDSDIKNALQEVRAYGRVATFHAEDGRKVKVLERKLKQSDRRTHDAFTLAHTSELEVSATRRAMKLAGQAGCHGHIAHISCKATLTEILSAKNAGVGASCEVTPHHLLLDEGKLREVDGLGITTPPLRTSSERAALWDAYSGGLIDVCATDHAPHTLEEKTSGDVWSVAPGVSGLDIFMPLLLSQVNYGTITLQRVIESTSKIPAEIFGLMRRGRLEPGYHADFILVDMKAKGRVRGDRFRSKAKFTPFEGWPLTAEVVSSYVNGKNVLTEREITSKPFSGTVLRSHKDEATIRPRRHAR